MLDLEKIKSIQISLLLKKSDVNSENKAEYAKKVTAKFTFPSDFYKSEENLGILLKEMYSDLIKNSPEDVDSLAIWIEYDNKTVENAILLRTLDDIVAYSKEEINPIYEFFKMSLQDNSYEGPNSSS